MLRDVIVTVSLLFLPLPLSFRLTDPVVSKLRKMAKKLCINAPESLQSAFLKWVSEKRQNRLSILITGKTGVGKSRLVNALVGEPVAKESRSTSACTNTVTSYKTEISDVEVVVWDSPGLQDVTCNERLYLQDMESKLSQGIDVMIYCISMTDRRFYDADKHAIRTLTEVFGNKLWKNSVVALTFANFKTKDPDEESDLDYFLSEKYFWEKEIVEFLAKLKVDLQVRQQIPIVPTGNYKQLCLPGCENWLSELWIKCFNVMSISSGLAFFKINESRLKYLDSSPVTASTATASTAAAACSSYNPDAHEDIPTEIPQNQEQEDGLLKRLWKAFLDVYEAAKNFGHRILRFFFFLPDEVIQM